jgi:putative transposase
LSRAPPRNATLARELLVGPILRDIDGAKALCRAITEVFDHPALARCQQHKLRNVRDRLPERLGPGRASHACRLHPRRRGVAVRGLAEALTVVRLGAPATLARTFHSTDPIELISDFCPEHAGNVKRWQEDQMALR